MFAKHDNLLMPSKGWWSKGSIPCRLAVLVLCYLEEMLTLGCMPVVDHAGFRANSWVIIVVGVVVDDDVVVGIIVEGTDNDDVPMEGLQLFKIGDGSILTTPPFGDESSRFVEVSIWPFALESTDAPI